MSQNQCKPGDFSLSTEDSISLGTPATLVGFNKQHVDNFSSPPAMPPSEPFNSNNAVELSYTNNSKAPILPEDEPDSQRPMWPTAATQDAFEYADLVWLITLYKQKITVYSELAHEVNCSVNDILKNSQLGEVQQEQYAKWKEGHKSELEEWAHALKELEKSHVEVFMNYQLSRCSKGLVPFEPSFTIDPTEPEPRLEIQRRYDVEREARHMSDLSITSQEFHEFRKQPGRCFYTGSAILRGTSPDVSVHAESNEIAEWLGTTYGIEDEETMKGYECGARKAWMGHALAKMVGRQVDGRPMEESAWEKYQSRIGYYHAERVYFSHVYNISVEKYSLFEEDSGPSGSKTKRKLRLRGVTLAEYEPHGLGQQAQTSRKIPARHTPIAATIPGIRHAGPVPAGQTSSVSDTVWLNAVKCADSDRRKLHALTGQGKDYVKDRMEEDRDNGVLRGVAIQRLKNQGKLDISYTDQWISRNHV